MSVDYTGAGWLDANATELSGNNSHTYSDVNDDDKAQGSEEVAAVERAPLGLRAAAVPPSRTCPSATTPTRAPGTRTSPSRGGPTAAQNTAQVFYFVNNWHDHLLAAPIGFTEAAGNFQLRNSTRARRGR